MNFAIDDWQIVIIIRTVFISLNFRVYILKHSQIIPIRFTVVLITSVINKCIINTAVKTHASHVLFNHERWKVFLKMRRQNARCYILKCVMFYFESSYFDIPACIYFTSIYHSGISSDSSNTWNITAHSGPIGQHIV